ncbi:MAG: hypothetical protein WDM88_07025 [Galbitalea sp.]
MNFLRDLAADFRELGRSYFPRGHGRCLHRGRQAPGARRHRCRASGVRERAPGPAVGQPSRRRACPSRSSPSWRPGCGRRPRIAC